MCLFGQDGQNGSGGKNDSCSPAGAWSAGAAPQLAAFLSVSAGWSLAFVGFGFHQLDGVEHQTRSARRCSAAFMPPPAEPGFRWFSSAALQCQGCERGVSARFPCRRRYARSAAPGAGSGRRRQSIQWVGFPAQAAGTVESLRCAFRTIFLPCGVVVMVRHCWHPLPFVTLAVLVGTTQPLAGFGGYFTRFN